MASVTVVAKGQDCIASGVVLAKADEPFEIAIADGDEVLKLRCSFIGAMPGHEAVDPSVAFTAVDEQTAEAVFSNIPRQGGASLSFGPLRVATFKDLALSLMFRVRHDGATVEVTYAFWLGVA